MEDIITYLAGFMALGIACRVCKLVKDIIVTIICALGLVVALRFTLTYVLKPVFRGLAWLGKKAWLGFRELCRIIDRHFQYRDSLCLEPGGNGLR